MLENVYAEYYVKGNYKEIKIVTNCGTLIYRLLFRTSAHEFLN